ncbi:tRNA-dependent cyclodipeptide synthase [Streptomyces rimosus]|uniref:tRNA-dependent cyclodipeptide synthase n=1 Tax=Streptomyces rimosus TaxID=1927 RepID=UPI00067CABCF|nr:tRNA-dependent cyclodipeptide synthase [Streptomyces rimosus]
MFVIEPLTERCRGYLPTATHVCIGVSPFNSYFTTARLRRLADWAVTRFESVHFFVPDMAAAHTLRALGYDLDHARHKARRQGQYVHNKITTALRALGVEDPAGLVWGMDRLHRTPRYLALFDEVHLRYEEDESFRAACLDASHWVLEHKLPPGITATEDQLREAVRYFLAELPLFIDAGGIAGHRVSFFVYHQRVAFLERFFRRELSLQPTGGQGFLVVREAAQDRPGTQLRTGAVPAQEAARGVG